jgi:excinuclease UvrABC ATPase subunit
VSDESECTICEGGGGWWQLEPSRTAVVYVHCEHCDGTGVEPEPTPIEEEL